MWLIFLAFGGGIMALYYARIRYLPNIEWSAALVHVGVGTIVGGAVALHFAMSLLLPGLIWSEFLIFDSKMEGQFCFDRAGKELCGVEILSKLGNEYYLVVNGQTFTLPKTAVQSYKSEDPRPPLRN